MTARTASVSTLLAPAESAELASTAAEVPRMYNKAIDMMFERTWASIELLIAKRG